MRKNIKGFEFLVDAKIRKSLFDRIKNLVQSLDISVFVASHYIPRVDRMPQERMFVSLWSSFVASFIITIFSTCEHASVFV